MKLTILAAAFLVAGCANQDYQRYTESQVAIQVAKSNAEAEKYKAMSAIAGTGDTTAKVVAMMAMQYGVGQQGVTQLTAPKSTSDTIREWVGMVLPVAVQGFGIYSNSQVAIKNSDNAARVSESTNNAFVGIAGKIQGNTFTDSSQVMSGTGAFGGAYSVQQPTPLVVPPVFQPVFQPSVTAP